MAEIINGVNLFSMQATSMNVCFLTVFKSGKVKQLTNT